MGDYLRDNSSPLQTISQPGSTQLAASSFLSGKYPDHVALWHSTALVRVPQPVLAGGSVSSSPAQQQQKTGQKKHRRTRTGCYTCRSRRVKCDETLPICDRCRKGNRNCVYPTPGVAPSKTSGSRSSARAKANSSVSSPGSDRSDQGEAEGADETRTLSAIQEDNAGATISKSRSHETQHSRSTAGNERKPTPEAVITRSENSASPSTTESSILDSLSSRSTSDGLSAREPYVLPSTIQFLPEDVQFYLNYHQQFLTHYHYFLRTGGDRFIHQEMVEYALQYDPLLYALAGFAAYHHSLQNPGGKIYTFLTLYHKALTLLRKSLGSGEEHGEATLITVLVLTSFEEYIGDWVSLIDHHQAAHALICELSTSESINTNETYRQIFSWYARFDVAAGILAGSETILSREWYISREEYDAEQALRYPNDIDKQLTYAASITRRIGLDMASLYAKLSHGMISMEEFMVQNDQLSQNLEYIKNILKQFDDSESAVTSYSHKVALTCDDIVDPYLPGGLYQGPLWDLNFAWIDLLSVTLMFYYQSYMTLQQPPPSELESLALEQCRLIETIDRWPDKPNGYFIGFKNSISLSSMFLPNDEKHRMWCRRKFAKMERNGYIYSPKFRSVLATMWQVPEMNYWWLPNDEDYPNIVREIRTMTDERMSKPRDNFREDVRNMKAVFGKLNLDDPGEPSESA